MLIFRKFKVRKHERGLLYKDGDFERFLYPGEHRLFDPQHKLTVERFDIAEPVFEHRLEACSSRRTRRRCTACSRWWRLAPTR